MFSRAKTKFPYRCIFIFYYKLFCFNFILIYSNLHLFFPFALVSVIFFMLKHVKIVQVEKKRFGPQNYGRGPFIRIQVSQDLFRSKIIPFSSDRYTPLFQWPMQNIYQVKSVKMRISNRRYVKKMNLKRLSSLFSLLRCCYQNFL